MLRELGACGVQQQMLTAQNNFGTKRYRNFPWQESIGQWIWLANVSLTINYRYIYLLTFLQEIRLANNHIRFLWYIYVSSGS